MSTKSVYGARHVLSYTVHHRMFTLGRGERKSSQRMKQENWKREWPNITSLEGMATGHHETEDVALLDAINQLLASPPLSGFYTPTSPFPPALCSRSAPSLSEIAPPNRFFCDGLVSGDRKKS